MTAMTAIEKLEPLAKLFPTQNAGQLHRRVLYYTGRDDFTGLRVLDVGAGSGLDSCAMALLGATEVVALEPETDGSTHNVTHTFRQNIQTLGLSNITLQTNTLQAYTAQPASFDVITLIAVINHLDEAGVVHMHKDQTIQHRFAEMLMPLHAWLKPGGTLAIYDAARHHALAPLIKLGILDKHPLAPSIEWHKHQQPNQWLRVLRQAGFSRFKVMWPKPRRMPIPLWNFVFHPYFTILAHKTEA